MHELLRQQTTIAATPLAESTPSPNSQFVAFCRANVCCKMVTVVGNCVENALTCYRAPRWPDPEFPRKIPKKYPPARNSGLPEFTPKIPKKYRRNTPKIPKMTVFGIFSVFWGIFWGVQNFGLGAIFSVFFVEIPGRATSGLCSRRGHSQELWTLEDKYPKAPFESPDFDFPDVSPRL